MTVGLDERVVHRRHGFGELTTHILGHPPALAIHSKSCVARGGMPLGESDDADVFSTTIQPPHSLLKRACFVQSTGAGLGKAGGGAHPKPSPKSPGRPAKSPARPAKVRDNPYLSP